MQNLKETLELLLIGNLNWNKLNRRLRIELKIEKGTRSSFVRRINIVPNVSHIPEGGDYEAKNFQLTMNKHRNTEFHFSTKTPLLGICCYS